MRHIEVVAAVIKNDENQYYCVRRGGKGEVSRKWEFPGGKIELGESHKEALIREINEELSADIEVLDFITTVKHKYSTFNLTMHVYYAIVIKGTLTLSEHTECKWLFKEQLSQLDWAPADIPVVGKLEEL